MNSAELLLNWYVALVRWETRVATPQDIVTATEAYPVPWRQWAELFEHYWQDGTCPDTLPMVCTNKGVDTQGRTVREWHDANDPTRSGLWLLDESLGFEIVAVDTPEAVILFDDRKTDRKTGFFRIPKKFGCEMAPGTGERGAG